MYNPTIDYGSALKVASQLEEYKYIPKDSAIPVYKIEESIIAPRQITHFVSDLTANLSNGNIVSSSEPTTKGVKTFTNDKLQFDFYIDKIKLRVGKASNRAALSTSTFSENLSAALVLGRVKIIQGTEIINVTAAELYEGNTIKSGDFFYLKSPIVIRKDVKFEITFEPVGNFEADSALRVELGGLEMATASTNFAKTC
jgi:hypothetical protein